MQYATLVNTWTWVQLPKFYGVIEINDVILFVEKKHKVVELNRPIFISISVLELSKTLMGFNYKYMKPTFPGIKLC